jgi:putative transposase
MVLYRRNWVPGGIFFFTVTLADRSADLLTTHANLLHACFAEIRRQRPFRTEAMVVMPDHLHTVWSLPSGDTEYPQRWRAIKAMFVRLLAREGIATIRNPRGEAAVWQSRFWEHTIRDDEDFERHVDYIHFNPVKHGYAKRPADWPHSSLHRYIRTGLRASSWGEDDEPSIQTGNYGE